MTDAALTLPPTLDELRVRRDEILAVAARNKAVNVRVFGSVARGDAVPGSDVDFLVDFEPGASLYEVAGLWLALKDLLGCEVDVVEDHPGLRERFRVRVMQESVSL